MYEYVPRHDPGYSLTGFYDNLLLGLAPRRENRHRGLPPRGNWAYPHGARKDLWMYDLLNADSVSVDCIRPAGPTVPRIPGLQTLSAHFALAWKSIVFILHFIEAIR